MSERSNGRRVWAVAESDLAREAAVQVCSAMLQVLVSQAPWAYVDAWSDYRDELPLQVQQAQEDLRRLQRERDGVDTGMGIDIDRTDAAQEALLRTYAAWSIHVELLSAAGQPALAVLHDGASSITAELTDAEVGQLRGRIKGVATVELLQHLHGRARLQGERQEGQRRARRLGRWLGSLRASVARPAHGDEPACGQCGHPQGAHPWPGRRGLTTCALCVYEEDHEMRTEAEMCRRTFSEPV
ncbi:hypothetical protein [Kineococcus rubinsiae]|uniref:hypothetical protein n=1 Tax=Kineococcus rubinsiae TaxID=2609562 RepID=UPI0014306119|nr:hypothetical protein [Kineococcus rubinsiae]NIZ90276.1 hypothetical protein [Kineococcus rubinsiae]